MTDETPTPKRSSLRRKIVVGGVATTAALGLAVPAVYAQESDDAPATEAPAPDAQAPEMDRQPFQHLVDEGVLTEEQATAVHDALEAARDENADLSREEREASKQEVLDSLVSEGTITEEQAQAIEDARPPHGHGHGHGLETAADAIGIEPDALREQLQSGSSIADVAEANGVDPQTVVDALVAEMNERIAQGVEDGRLTEDEAAERQAEAADRAEEIANRPGDERPMGPADGPRRGPEDRDQAPESQDQAPAQS